VDSGVECLYEGVFESGHQFDTAEPTWLNKSRIQGELNEKKSVSDVEVLNKKITLRVFESNIHNK
jgi:hypothetical protein